MIHGVEKEKSKGRVRDTARELRAGVAGRNCGQELNWLWNNCGWCVRNIARHIT